MLIDAFRHHSHHGRLVILTRARRERHGALLNTARGAIRRDRRLQVVLQMLSIELSVVIA